MNLTKESLPDYFTIASPENSHYKTQVNTFDFIGNNKTTLVVTVGESWTWGSDITEDNNEETRLAQVYGRLLANSLQADWLNLAQPGTGNFWIAERVEEFAKIIDDLSYEKIYVICTFTEVGRSFDSTHDRYINYIDWFENNDYRNFLKFLNQECIHRIVQALGDRVHLKIGSNFVNHCGFTDDEIFLKKTWIECIKGDISTPCHVMMHGLEHLKKSRQFFLNSEDYLNWMMELIELAKIRSEILSDTCNFRSVHPLANGHRTWANYILGALQ
jgi:hypothetical protein